jgi:hypothetical protein
VRILFLDIDGVLCTDRANIFCNTRFHEKWDPCVIDMLHYLCTAYDLQIVITSDWRIKAPEILDKRLKESGLIAYLHEEKFTKNFRSRHTDRDDEILDWIHRNNPEDFIIIDDVDKFSICSELRDHFFLTDDAEGITMKVFEKIKYYLERN